MDLILCHTTADFDALGAAVGLTRLHPGSRIVLTGGTHPAVRDFLALHRDEYPLIERRSVNPKHIRSIVVVDTQLRDRLGKAAEWLDLPHLTSITVYDHHLDTPMNIPATHTQVEAVGATTTLIAEKLQTFAASQATKSPIITSFEATVMALGIHVDTGSLTFDHATPRDAAALAWLMAQGANLRVIAEYIDPGLSPQLQELLTTALDQLQTETLRGYTIAWVLLKTDAYVPGLSSLASRLIDLTESDALLLGNSYGTMETGEERLSVIGRSRIEATNLNLLFQSWGGGGHVRAASLALRAIDPLDTLKQLLEQLKAQIPHPPTARELMSSPVRTIRPETSIGEAHRILLRYGHSGLSIVDESDHLVGIISRRDIDIALHHGFSHAPVKGYMTPQLKTITPETTLPEIEALMVLYDIGRLPVLDKGYLVGIVTRTDVLRQLHQQQQPIGRQPLGCIPGVTCTSIQTLLQERLAAPLWHLLTLAAQLAQQQGLQLYLVGGCVRDLLLANPDAAEGQPIPHPPIWLDDIDLVVERNLQPSTLNSLSPPTPASTQPQPKSPAVELAHLLRHHYPAARIDVHGQFQTAALLWHKDPELGSLWIDIATARTEFYPYPAANPEVEASSIRQDLYRRDFTINALAVRLTALGGGENPPSSSLNNRGNLSNVGELLDFFGGLSDLQSRQIRVLHANSFIEDPTRIYRAVRFAVRLGFHIESQTENYIRYAINSGIYDSEARHQTTELQPPLDAKPPSTISDHSEGKPRLQNLAANFPQNRRKPALETRLKSELKYILTASYWKAALQLLGNLGALRCIHPTLELDPLLWWQVRLVDRGLRYLKFKTERQSHPLLANLPADTDWLMRLEVIIAYLAPEYRQIVAARLQMTTESIQRFQKLEAVKTEIVTQLPTYQKPSQVVWQLRQYDLPLLILVAVQVDSATRRRIWQYLMQYARIESPLNGNDLKALGYKPGKQFKQILDTLLAAVLDGEIPDRSAAETFIAQHYPLL